jgi:hypothetical protein
VTGLLLSALITWNLGGFGVPKPVVVLTALLFAVWHWPILVVAFWLRLLDEAFIRRGGPRPPRRSRFGIRSEASAEDLL